MVTPLRSPSLLDPASLEKLIEHLIAGGASGIFVLGTTGEGPCLPLEVRKEVIERSARQLRGRDVPLLVGVSDTSSIEATRLAEFSAKHDAAGVVITAPIYFPVTQDEVLQYLGRMVPRFPLPVFLYNLPSHVGYSISVETAVKASEIPNLIGFKDSSGDLEYFGKLARALQSKTKFTLMNGPEQILAQCVQLGAHGGICGGANLFPNLYVRLYEAASNGSHNDVAELQATVDEVCQRIYGLEDGPASNYIRRLKYALSALGLCGDAIAEPYAALADREREEVRLATREIEATCQPV
jgi:4-hydroxy-tetrahydrodipicolinate synthase